MVEQATDGEPSEVVMLSARRILNVVQAVYGECDYAALSVALATAAGMALARFHWPHMPQPIDCHTIGGCMGDGVRQGFEDKTRGEVSTCWGRA